MKFVVSISGYGQNGARPVTLRCFHDAETDFLIFDSEVPEFTEVRPEGFALITNLELQTRDFLFTNDHIRDAIRDYYARDGQGLIDIDDALNGYRPDNKIERDGIDERGPKYRLSPDISNGEVGMLAAVAFITGQGSIISAMDAMGDFTKMYSAFEV